MSIDVIFDKIGYKGSFQDNLHKLIGHTIGNESVSL